MAELAIGSVSFFFQVFAGCIQGYELIADACRLEKDAGALLVKFKLEEHRLINWAKTVRVDYRDEQLILNHMSKGLIINIMEQQQKLLFAFGRLDRRYKDLTNPLLKESSEQFVLQNSDRLLENGESSAHGTAESKGTNVQFPPTEELVKMAMNFMGSFKNAPKRLRWAVFDHRKMEGLIANLSDFNDKMHEALDKAQLDYLVDMQTRTHDQIILLNRTMSQMFQIYTSDRLTFRRQYSLPTAEDHDYDDLAYGSAGPLIEDAARSPLAALTQQNFIRLAIEDSRYQSDETAGQFGLPHLAEDISHVRLSPQDVRPKHGQFFPETLQEGVRTEGFFQGAPVWVEWKTPDPSGPYHPESIVDGMIHERVKKLAALLSRISRTVHFRIPFCRGYFIDEDEGRFGLVFEKPASVSADTEPTSLRTLLQASNAPDSNIEMPSLTDRITLMRLVAQTVERLHAVDWLHKGLRSSNVLLFAKPDGTFNFTDPYISGFDYSRPATSDDMTERPADNTATDIYRHPSVQHKGNREDASGRESYKKSFDLYSLGLVLLEIAYWRPIEVILNINLPKAKPKDTWGVRKRLLETEPAVLRFVKQYSGNTVEEVIRACLEGPRAFGLQEDADERREVVAASLQRGFGEKVVKRLALMKGI